MVPLMEVAARYAAAADIFVVVGTSMVVYPAAGLIDYVPYDALKYVVDPHVPDVSRIPGVKVFQEKASTGMDLVRKDLLKHFG
jgi:NAD-dependent deacetylase